MYIYFTIEKQLSSLLARRAQTYKSRVRDLPRSHTTSQGQGVVRYPISHKTLAAQARTPARRSELVRSCSAIRGCGAAAGPRLQARRDSKWFNSAGLLAHRPPCSWCRDCRAPGTGMDVARGCELCERRHWEGHAPPPQGGWWPGSRGGGRRRTCRREMPQRRGVGGEG